MANAFESSELFFKLAADELGITLTNEHQDLLGEFPDPNRLQEFCIFYIKHPNLHPIWRASSVDQILGSLSMKYELGTVAAKDLSLVKEVVHDASTNPWASSLLNATSNEYDPNIDPGDYEVNEWLLNDSGIDMNLIEAQRARFNNPSDYLE